jgi:threonine dehydratase
MGRNDAAIAATTKGALRTVLTLEQIRQARRRIAGRVHVTPLVSASLLGERVGVRLFLKCESLQKTGSFKVRGALHKLTQLDAGARARGVVTVSAGNHAQALAWAARAEGVGCTVVMPVTASESKAAASAGYGAEVIRHGTSMEAFAKARELAESRGLTFVHPFDDEDILAGAGTAGLELLDQLDDVDVVVVPIGGGGLIGGVASALKLANPKVRVFGVEPVGASVMRQSLDAGRPLRAGAMNTIADGLAAPMAGEIPFDIVRRCVDDVVLVSDEEIMDAMRDLLSRTKLLAEPAGAAAAAAILSGKLPLQPATRVVALLSGGNVDLERLREVLGPRC